jgi:hypothetical protein
LGVLITAFARHRKGQAISSAMAESAVNQVINARMCKRQQMRWTPRGAHLLAQVRCAVLNGDAAEKLRATKRQTRTAWTPRLISSCSGYNGRHEYPTVFNTPCSVWLELSYRKSAFRELAVDKKSWS